MIRTLLRIVNDNGAILCDFQCVQKKQNWENRETKKASNKKQKVNPIISVDPEVGLSGRGTRTR